MYTFIKYNVVMSTILMTFVIVIKKGNSFTFNEKARQVFLPATTTNGHSYFGYSILLRWGKVDQPLIIVGAPRETIRNINYSEIKEPGSIYMCKILPDVNESLCTENLLEREGNTMHISSANANFNYHDRKDNMWLGMAVGGSHSNGEIAMMCSPRWMNQIESGGKVFYIPGMCYSLPHTKKMAADRRDISKLTPLVNSSNVLLENNGEVRAYGQAGMSMKLSKTRNELILGAPGTSNWIGSVVRFSIKKENLNKKNEKNTFNKTNIYTPQLEDMSYFGYSVDSGKFISKSRISYVAGAPRAANYKGKVLIFDFMQPNNKPLATLTGHNVGEYFGSNLAAIDIQEDGFTDLIVGAPSYAEKSSYDQGRVYVYINEKGKMKTPQGLSGDSQTGARFGSSIATIGDINNDGFTDVAIGAPYENDGMGAVYIYLGAEDGLDPKYTQKIVMDDMRGFGISLSSGVDIDQNSCQDLAIGAYDSAKVVLLRCHPSVGVTSTIEAIPSELSLNSTNFIAKICHNFTGATTFTTELKVNIFVDQKYQSASLANPREATYIAISNGTSSCKEITININPEKSDFDRLIVIGMNFDLKKEPLSDAHFCKDCVVLTPSTQREFPSFLRVPFATGCGHICQPDLSVKVEVLERTPYVIGTSTVITLNISVTNVGELAFKPQAMFTPPAIAPLYRVPQRCLLLQSLLSCDVEKLEKGEQTFLIIELDASKLTSSHSIITFNVSVSSIGNEVSPEDNTYTLEIPLKTEANITIGEATGDKNVNFNPDVQQLLNISHTYVIRNEGPTSLDVFQMKYYIPIAYRDDKTNIIYDLVNVYKPEDDSFSCSVQDGHFLLEGSKENSIDFDYNPIETNIDTVDESVVSTKGTDLPEEIISKSDEDPFSLFDEFNMDKEDNLPNLMTNLSLNWGGNNPSIQVHISCVDKMRVTCMVVNCTKTGGLSVGGNGALTVLRMQLITSNITKLEGAMILTTYAVALQPSKVIALTHSLIESMPTSASTATPFWIIMVAVTIGFLVLAIISFILNKCNFFKRKSVPEESLKDDDFILEPIDGNTYNRSTLVDSVVEEQDDYTEVMLTDEDRCN